MLALILQQEAAVDLHWLSATGKSVYPFPCENKTQLSVKAVEVYFEESCRKAADFFRPA